MTDLATVRYAVEGNVCTLTMDRPEVANAQNTQLIDDLDAAFDAAGADDEVRVVVLTGAGRHFSSGHDLKALVGDVEADEWRQMRDTPEGKFEHEKVMYFDRCLRIRDFPKPTIAAVNRELRGGRPDAGLYVRPDRGGGRRRLLEPGPAHDRCRRRDPRRAVGDAPAQGQGVPSRCREVHR